MTAVESRCDEDGFDPAQVDAEVAVVRHAVDGRDLDAVVHADASIVLGLAAGVLTLDDTTGLVDIEGDDAAVRAVFNPRRTDAEGSARR